MVQNDREKLSLFWDQDSPLGVSSACHKNNISRSSLNVLSQCEEAIRSNYIQNHTNTMIAVTHDQPHRMNSLHPEIPSEIIIDRVLLRQQSQTEEETDLRLPLPVATHQDDEAPPDTLGAVDGAAPKKRSSRCAGLLRKVQKTAAGIASFRRRSASSSQTKMTATTTPTATSHDSNTASTGTDTDSDDSESTPLLASDCEDDSSLLREQRAHEDLRYRVEHYFLSPFL